MLRISMSRERLIGLYRTDISTVIMAFMIRSTDDVGQYRIVASRPADPRSKFSFRALVLAARTSSQGQSTARSTSQSIVRTRGHTLQPT